ncbi:cell surface A33 antigen isoform 1 precursor [Mus musculus]|uniref:Cell surface A33 antigen n=2 Tax=Mus musculus TaxID=10090 RepID=A0A0R4J209_MOUSE|nr:cell surface A33 antigen isoform 1 precursor [Mus musculus]AAF65818.1 transmembrane glycoprotein A33 antigen [Mus musculus]EDL39202.1 glycoprotein A33 (transmembrane), isoform CRA_a [Mus musculus]EDL39204.1 glycoprotein A33 (transmembrane), isoform CRA_a [Mus musculus]|eukprot:NP_067623.1 cell surface A33 antigen precursor [Mus musculus]
MLGKAGSVVWMFCAIWVAADALTVETTQDILRAARGRSVTLPCTYNTYVSDREGFIQWDKLLRSQTERVVTWNFVTKKYIYGNRYENRVRVSNDAELSNASITIDQLTMDDNGTYECSVSLMSDQDVNAKSRVRLLVLVPPSKPDCSIQGEMVIGNNIQLTCHSAEGSPSPQYSWKSYNAQNQQRPLTQPVSGEPLLLKNISTETAGYYICTSSNDVGIESCNITVAPRPPSMNIALYAGIAGSVFVALIIIGVIVYCCCCREKDDKDQDREDARPNRAAYQVPKKEQKEISRGREDEDDHRHEDRWSSGRSTPDQPFQ